MERALGAPPPEERGYPSDALDDFADLNRVDRDRALRRRVRPKLLDRCLRLLFGFEGQHPSAGAPSSLTHSAPTKPGACDRRGIACSCRNFLPCSTS